MSVTIIVKSKSAGWKLPILLDHTAGPVTKVAKRLRSLGIIVKTDKDRPGEVWVDADASKAACEEMLAAKEGTK